MQFDIPAQRLSAALVAFSEQAGIQLVTAGEDVSQHSTAGVSGRRSIAAALSKLLSGTSLRFRTVGESTVVLVDETANARQHSPVHISLLHAADANIDDVSRAAETDAKEGSRNLPKSDIARDTARDGGEATEMLVTGARIGLVNEGVIPRAEDGAVNYTVLDRAAIARSGATDLASLFQRAVPQNTGYGTSLQANAGLINATGGAGGPRAEAINLRGFGSNQTVVLVNGRRLYGGEGRPGDVNRVPLSAIERVEILPGSASALYGGNAVAGVVNIVLRRDFSGHEMSGSFGVASDGSAPQGNLAIHSGWTGNDGRTQLVWSADYTRSQALEMSERDFAARALRHIPFGSSLPTQIGQSAYNFIVLPFFAQTPATVFTSSALGLGIPGNPSAQYAVVPAGSDGLSLTPASFSSTVNQANVGLNGRAASGALLPGLERFGSNAGLEHALYGDALGLYAELGFSYEPQQVTNFNYIVQANLSATHPLNPFRTDVTPGFVGRAITVYMYPDDALPVSRQGIRRVGRLVTGLKGVRRVGARRWNWALDGSWEGNRNRGDFNEYALTRIFAINAGLYNPLRDVSANPHSADIFGQNYRHVDTEEETEITTVNLRINGDLWRLPAGWARVSVMGESRREDFFSLVHNQTVGTLLAAVFPPGRPPTVTETSRRASSAGLEAAIPVVGGQWRPGGMHGLELNLAWRYERYSDFRGEQTSMAALKFAPTRDVALRVSYGEAYNPPTQSQLLSAVSSSFFSGGAFTSDPRRGGENVGPFGLTVIGGGNSGLQAETSDMLNIGLILTPRILPAFTVTLDYFQLHKVNQVESANLISLFVANEDLFGARITRAAATAEDIAMGWAGRITTIDSRALNLSDVNAKGYDLNVKWSVDTARHGRFDFNALATYATSYRTQLDPRAPKIEMVDYVGLLANPPVSFRGNAGFYWSRDRINAGLTARYIDAYKTDSTTPTAANAALFLGDFDGAQIPASTEWDLQFGYRWSAADNAGGGWRSWVDGTSCSLRVNNLFDRAPPYITDRNGFYSRFNDPRMRFFIFEMQKSF